jgi:histidinol dehydrogenase
VEADKARVVQTIVDDVRVRGDAALAEWSVRLDGELFRRARMSDASADFPTAAVQAAARNVRAWHAVQRPQTVELEQDGVHLQRRWVPIETIGVYIPKGLVSTVYMTVVAAQEAGVKRIVICTPRDGSGNVAAAAQLIGVDEVWALGGAQAIAALAYGTESMPRVDKIVGPGNSYVNLAKLAVSKDVAIDLPAGPSEILVVAGPDADPQVVERELAAQQEHGPESICECIHYDGDAEATLAEINARAPEHLHLLGRDVEPLAARVRSVGAIFVGHYSPVASGDYATGGNHVLPTGGWARSCGGLGVESFLKPITTQRVTEDGLARLRPIIQELARLEGMPAHAASTIV